MPSTTCRYPVPKVRQPRVEAEIESLRKSFVASLQSLDAGQKSIDTWKRGGGGGWRRGREREREGGGVSFAREGIMLTQVAVGGSLGAGGKVLRSQ